MNYNEYSQKTSSTKIGLVHVFPRQRWKEWSLVSGNVYDTNVNHLVSSVHVGTVALTQVFSTPGTNEWRFVETTKKVQINVGSPPVASNVIFTYKLCFGTGDFSLPNDLSTGYEVQYDGKVKDIQDIRLELDYENAGIALETSSSISFENSDGYFDQLFDTLIWENQPIRVYSWGTEIPITQARKIFDGIVDTKSFSPSEIKLNLKDQFKRLREKVQLPVFDETDGDIDDSTLGSPKRRIYGRANQLRCVGIDKTLDGFELAGTITCDVLSTNLVGVGTSFLSELSPEDTIKWIYGGEEFDAKIQSVTSDTAAVLSDEIEVPLSGDITCLPAIPYRLKNRNWHIAGHKLYEPSVLVTEPLTLTRFKVDSVEDLEAGLILNINGQTPTIEEIRGDNVVLLSQALTAQPAVSDPATVTPVINVYYGKTPLVINRDYTLSNTSTDAILEIDPLAEFNITKPFKTVASFTFTNGSRTVSCATTGFDLKTAFRSRDWIRADSITRPTWFEILAVDEDTITLRSNFTEATYSGSAQRKNVEIINDDSLILVTCNGLENASGVWVKNASRAVKDVLSVDLGLTNLNLTAFTAAESDAPQLISYFVPKSLGSDAPVIRDVITDINKSVFGAVYQDENFDFTFSVLQSEKDEDLEEITEDEVLSYTITTKPQIVNKVLVKYQHFTDRFSTEDTFKLAEWQNAFVDELSGIQNTLEVDAYLYRDSDASVYSQRLGFLRAVTNSIIQVKGKLSLKRFTLGDRALLNFDRLYVRYGSNSRLKAGVCYLISQDEGNVTLGFNDFNGMFTRVPSIAPNTAPDYSGATQSEIAKFGYILNNNTETPDGTTNAELGSNLIG